MNSNRILLLVTIALGIILSYYFFTSDNRTIKGELRDFAIEDTALVDRIFLADKQGHKALLERQASGVWTVGEYQARPQAVRDLLFTLNKMVVKAPVAKSMQPKVLKDLSGIGQRKIEIYAGKQLLKTIYVGIETMDKMGTYMMIEGSSVPFEVHIPGHRGFLQTRFIVDPRLWRDPVLFRTDYRDIRTLDVRYTNDAASSFSIRYDGKIPVLMANNTLVEADTLLLYQYMNQFRNVVYEYVVTESFPQAKKDSILNSKPFVQVSLTDKAGKRTLVEGFYRGSTAKDLDQSGKQLAFDPDRMYALLNDKDFLLVQYFQFDRVMVKPYMFLKR
jgi:hypothetical protein